MWWELTGGSVYAGVCAAVEAAEAKVGAVGVALAGAPAVVHRAGALGVRQRAGGRALPSAAIAVSVAAVAAEGSLGQAVVLLAHSAVHVVPESILVPLSKVSHFGLRAISNTNTSIFEQYLGGQLRYSGIQYVFFKNPFAFCPKVWEAKLWLVVWSIHI